MDQISHIITPVSNHNLLDCQEAAHLLLGNSKLLPFLSPFKFIERYHLLLLFDDK
jgi:hypothetical protein